MSFKQLYNAPAPNTRYFTPAQHPASGTAVDPQPEGKPVPTLFQPLKIRGLEFHNRLWVRTHSAALYGWCGDADSRAGRSALPVLCG